MAHEKQDKPDKPQPTKALRERAEKMSRTSRFNIANMGTEEVQRLVLELQTHQMELRFQNEELRDAQVELAESRDRYSDLYDFAPVGYVTLDRNGMILDANLTAATLLGAERQILCASNISNFVVGQSLDTFCFHHQAVLSNKTKQVCELEIVRADGSAMQIRLESIAYGEEADRRCGTAMIDINDRKKAEDALHGLAQELEQRVVAQTGEIRLLAGAVSHLAEGVVITDDELDWPGPRIQFVNEAMSRITGYSKDELVGKTPRILQGEHVDRSLMESLKSELAAGRSFLCEMINYRKDGTPYDAELFVNPLNDDTGHRTNFVSIHRDITKRKQAERAIRQNEERIRSILRTAADAIITIDQRGVVVDANLATEQMFGFDHSELIGENVKILMPPPFHDEHDGYIARYMQTGQARIIGTGREVVGRRKDGSLFPIWLAVSEVDHLHLFTGIIRDLSKTKELEKHLLEIASDEQRRIGQELHDGTGQELTGLSLFAGTLLQKLRTATLRNIDGTRTWLFKEADFQVLEKSATRLSQGLVVANRHVHQLSHGIMPVQVDAEGLRSALTELASLTDGHDNITCRFSCPDSILVSSNTAATHLYRIAQEALNNALKHGQAHKILISLYGKDGQIVLEVDDDGIGFDPNARHVAGHVNKGMGLSTMEYRASVIGGVLRIEHKPERGIRLTCTFSRGGKVAYVNEKPDAC